MNIYDHHDPKLYHATFMSEVVGLNRALQRYGAKIQSRKHTWVALPSICGMIFFLSRENGLWERMQTTRSVPIQIRRKAFNALRCRGWFKNT